MMGIFRDFRPTARAKANCLIMLICLCIVCWQYRSTYKEDWSSSSAEHVDLDSNYYKLSTDPRALKQMLSPGNKNDKRPARELLDYSNNDPSKREVYVGPFRAQELHQDKNNVNVIQSTVTIPTKQSIKQDMKRCSLSLGVSVKAVKHYSTVMDKIASTASIFLDSLWEIIPTSYIPGMKNPCWYSNLTISSKVAHTLVSKLDQGKSILSKGDLRWLSRQLFGTETKHNGSVETLYCLPYFVVAGFAKSGTTTLHSELLQHPLVAPPEVKEPHWWTRTPLGVIDHDFLKIAVVRYLVNFLSASKTIESDSSPHRIITYDASTSLLPDSMFKVERIDFCALVSVISRVLPNVKVIVLIRDPVSRAYSQFYYMHGPFRKWPQEMKDNASLFFHKYTSLSIENFYDCLSQNKSDYECVHGVTTGRKELRTWIGLGVYYIHMLKWMQFFPRENFLFLETKELNTDIRGVLEKVTNFLGLNSSSEWITPSMLSGQKENVRPSFLNDKKFEMMTETKLLLEAFYRPYNVKLSNLINANYSK